MAEQGYCVKCKSKKDMNLISIGKTKRGTFMLKGTCTACGCKMSAIVSKDKANQVSSENNMPLPN